MKKRIRTSDIKADIERGMSDREFMKKYGLSEKGLNRLFEKFLKAASTGVDHLQIESEGLE